jgi:hypothetical protein
MQYNRSLLDRRAGVSIEKIRENPPPKVSKAIVKMKSVRKGVGVTIDMTILYRIALHYNRDSFGPTHSDSAGRSHSLPQRIREEEGTS